MTQFFQFESDFVESLRCIPMAVRFKLDTCGVKLKLDAWNQFSQVERQALLKLPCKLPQEVQAYRDYLEQRIREHTGAAAIALSIDSDPDWLNETSIPETVLQKATECGQALSLSQWQHLTPLQRFALIKLSRSNHENRNFLPALHEFHLA